MIDNIIQSVTECKKSRWRGGERHRISETALRHFPTKIDKRKTAKAL